jgi:membrane associated rhomboid family serine protease
MSLPDYQTVRPREPMFNVPGIIVILIAVLAAVHGWRALLDPESDVIFLREAAFIPARLALLLVQSRLPEIVARISATADDPGSALAISRFFLGDGSKPWTLLTYAFLHGSFAHLAMNSLWLLAFGSPVARRFGPARLIALFGVGAIAGALVHYLSHALDIAPLVGASAAISAFMAAATRFMFGRRRPLNLIAAPEPHSRPAPPLRETLTDPRVLIFLAVWFGTNILFGAFVSVPGAGEATIAWQAHVGGFIAGFLLFPFFDPVPPAASPRR